MVTKIIAHRGASGLVEFDNSFESFRKAIEIGADMVEFDVRRTEDGKLIAFHDPSLEGEEISSLTYEEIQEITDDKGYNVPAVEDVVLLFKDKIGLDIELKEGGYEDEVIKIVKRHLDYDEFIMKSFLDSAVKAVKEYDDNIKTGLLLGIEDPEYKIKTRLSELFPKGRLKRCGLDFVAPNYQLLKLFFLRRMKYSDIDVFVWTVNNPVRMNRLMRKAVEGIITDRPDIALEVKRNIIAHD
ncbi:MAG: glycerophosphodiester phosphodiesterase [Thermoplasmata archaeon]